MKQSVTIAMVLAMLFAAPAWAQKMEVSRVGDRNSIIGPDKFFTGTAVVDRLFAPNTNLNGSGATVTFAPGARSGWHSHPAGQMVIVTAGRGWVQEEGQKRIVITAGDVVWTPPGVKHWHGAAPAQSMSHLVISMMRDGKNVLWMEKVDDAHYSQMSK